MDHIGPYLDNREKYLHCDKKERLVQLAVVKAQFELIHPFLEGKGHIGRMLVPIFLFAKGILSISMFCLSAYFEANREVYCNGLQAISKAADWNGWIQFFLMVVSKQAKINTGKTQSILALYDHIKKDITESTYSQCAISAIDAMFDRPVFQSPNRIRRS